MIYIKVADELKTKIFTLCMLFMTVLCFAEDEGVRLIPMLNYDFVSLENQKIHAPGGGLILLNGDQEPPLSDKYNNLMVGLFYKPYVLKEVFPGYSELYNDIDFIVERKIGSHLIQGIFSTFSDKPVHGGFQTTYTSIGYGHELIKKEKINLTLGLALGAGDFGINLPNGSIWPLLPMPKPTALYIGSKATDDNKQWIKDVAHHKNIDIYQVKMDNRKFGILFEKIIL